MYGEKRAEEEAEVSETDSESDSERTYLTSFAITVPVICSWHRVKTKT